MIQSVRTGVDDKHQRNGGESEITDDEKRVKKKANDKIVRGVQRRKRTIKKPDRKSYGFDKIAGCSMLPVHQ